LDAAGNNGLWVTNGTSAGTYELTNISSGGLNPSGLALFNNEVLFNGLDAAGHHGLWVTNGAAAGTYEITNISGANSGGLQPSDLTVFNNEVLFNGLDAADRQELWVTNGTASGTHELNGMPDLLWRNTSSGDVALWNSNGAESFVFQDFGVVPSSWQIQGTGDFNGDGKADLLWLNTSSGDVALWNSNGAESFAFQDLGVVPSIWNVDETLVASAANNTLYLNSGATTVVIDPGSGQDTILNFQTTQDTLQFSTSLFANYAAASCVTFALLASISARIIVQSAYASCACTVAIGAGSRPAQPTSAMPSIATTNSLRMEKIPQRALLSFGEI
jgi:ELWxxDGT repeat protein